MTPLYVKTGSKFREATRGEIYSHAVAKSCSSELADQPKPPATHHVRQLTVGYDPNIRLQGRWLENAGFKRDAKVRVNVHERRLVIEVIETPLR
jgi:hypothetical protein